MLQRFDDRPGVVLPDNETQDGQIDLDRLIAAARRQWKAVALAAGIGFFLGIAYIFTAVPEYTSSTSLLIDSGNSQIVNRLSAINGVMDEEGSVLSQIEILRSRKIALAVVDNLDLLDDADFNAAHRSMIGRVVGVARSVVDFKSWFVSKDVAEDAEIARDRAADALLKGMEASRVGRTYVLSISYTSTSAFLAARIANGFAEAYLSDQLDSKYDATRRASDWLQKRIEELRQKSLETDLAVQKFKAQKGLISTGGELITDQQLTQLNAQLVSAQAEAASTKAKYDRIQNIIKSGQMDASVADSLNSSVITELQMKFLDASRRQADIASRLGEKHFQAVRLKTEMQDYKRLMFEELARIAEAYNSNYKVDLAREQTLKAEVVKATNVSANANDSQVQLRELEREADTYKSLYETFLQRYQEATQQQSFPITEARIISGAKIPQTPSKPNKPLALSIFLFLGLAFGSGFGAFREFQDRYFRTGDQVREELGLEYLGQIPLEADELYAGGAEHGSTGLGSDARFIQPIKSVSNYVSDHPLSAFAETLRSAKIACDMFPSAMSGKIIGVVSTVPGEGKSTVSVNLSQLLAIQGHKVLLIDGDLRNPGASRAIASNATTGLFEVVAENEPLRNALLTDPRTKLTFLPNSLRRRLPYSAEILTSKMMSDLLASMAADFDYIVIDLPPMGAVVDARAMAPFIDCYIMVAEWGKTTRKAVRTALTNNQTIIAKCAGVILNKVDIETASLYAEQSGEYYYHKKYGAYYTNR